MWLEREEARLLSLGAAFGLLTDLGISMAIVYVVGMLMFEFGISIPIADELAEVLGIEDIEWILVVFVGIQIMKLLVWARGVVTDILFFHAYKREYLIDMFLGAITKAELPKTEGGIHRAGEPAYYFDSILADESLDCQKRIEAAYWLAVLQFPTNVGNFWEGVQLDAIMQHAINKYDEHFDLED